MRAAQHWKFGMLCLAWSIVSGGTSWAQSASRVPAVATVKTAVKHPVELVRDVQFGQVGERKLKLHLVRPRLPLASPAPVIVWIHGGGWQEGSKETGLPLLASFAEQGYIGASIEYRFSQEAAFPAQLHDCKCAIRFLRSQAKQYQLDPDRIGVWGLSAGGHLSALLATSGGIKELEGDGGHAEFSSRVQVACDWCGPGDFLAWNPETAQPWVRNCVEQLFGGTVAAKSDLAKLASPARHVTRDDPPLLIMHGDRDTVVPLAQSELLHAALRKQEVETTLTVIKDGGHLFFNPETSRQVHQFFDHHLLRPAPRE